MVLKACWLAVLCWISNHPSSAFAPVLPVGVVSSWRRIHNRIRHNVDGTTLLGQEEAPLERESTTTISPYHVLHPNVSPEVWEYPIEPKSLHTVLSLMRDALALLAEQSTSNNNNNNHKDSRPDDDVPSFTRIEHPIARGTIDPLAWLSAQHHRLVAVLAASSSSAMRNSQSLLPPMSYFYCQNQEEDFEVAAMGAAHTCNATRQVWSLLERTDWPRSSRFYGGQRFDSGSSGRDGPQQRQPQRHDNHHVSPEWNEYGSQAWWFLPTVELRQEGASSHPTTTTTVLALHIHQSCPKSIQQALHLLHELSDTSAARRPPTTLPPVISRSNRYYHPKDQSVLDGRELYETALSKAIETFDRQDTVTEDEGAPEKLCKVVICRKQTLEFAVSDWCALAVLKRWKYGGHEGGHMFWMQPAPLTHPNSGGDNAGEFFGCTPERLFRVQADRRLVQSEALAGTRPRGPTAAQDAELLAELLESPKDRQENEITASYIDKAFAAMSDKGWTQQWKEEDDETIISETKMIGGSPSFFVRRLLHLQHLCQSIKAHLTQPSQALNVSKFLLTDLHPTPAVCGAPYHVANDFIRKYESVGFDRGFYSGPVGYLGVDASDIFVGLRSALLTRNDQERSALATSPAAVLHVYAGGGAVHNSTVKGEWAETNYKLEVISSIFPPSPMTLKEAATPNVAWAAAFIEELIRNGVTQFYVCPGSRSTPLVVALSRASRSHGGVVQLMSVHDERATAFRALGYARGVNRPAAVVTSSGTAVANLYPAIVEAGMDGVPLLLLTADRPYENRDTGANQAIDQVKMFSEKYIRWFRDILPPSDEVPISLALSDAGHAVNVARTARGPVHLNIQFRENLAPDEGRIRNDGRAASTVRFDAAHFTETPKFKRWSLSGNVFTKNLAPHSYLGNSEAIAELSQLIVNSRRGLIVVGNIRPCLQNEGESQLSVAETISDFAEMIGFPIIAGAQNVALRFRSSSVVLFAEHLLKCPLVAKNLNPDLIIQLGAPLVSTEVPSIIAVSIENSVHETSHVLIHPQPSPERVDPYFTVTHHISSDLSILNELREKLPMAQCGSELAPLVCLGRHLRGRMRDIIREVSDNVRDGRDVSGLSEPETILALSEALSTPAEHALFLSNSMAIRDSEFFLYPLSDSPGRGVCSVGSNRGASGIDGIISSAVGFAEGIETPTTLLIGDVSALHDIGSLHNLANHRIPAKQDQRHAPLNVLVVNNDGGGIFSFLPVAQHGQNVSFDEFFGTPTEAFSFKKGAAAFGLPYRNCDSYDGLREAHRHLAESGSSSITEAIVLDRESNVAVHREITRAIVDEVDSLIREDNEMQSQERSMTNTSQDSVNGATADGKQKTLVLLHGWMGDKSDWDEIVVALSRQMPSQWQIKAIDLAGHGITANITHDIMTIRRSLKFPQTIHNDLSVDFLSKMVVKTLEYQGIKSIDGLAGYSLGGRVALALRDKFMGTGKLFHNETKLVLLSSFTEDHSTLISNNDVVRTCKDDEISDQMRIRWYTSVLGRPEFLHTKLRWDSFLEHWYSSQIWGTFQSHTMYKDMKRKRSKVLDMAGFTIARSLSGCSPPRNKRRFGARNLGADTLVIAGALDRKYCEYGKRWQKDEGVTFEVIEKAGHALLHEAPLIVSQHIANFLTENDFYIDRSPGTKKYQRSIRTLAIKHTKEPIGMTLHYRAFRIPVGNSNERNGLQGIGWGDQASTSNELQHRSGYIIELRSESDGRVDTGIGEIAPLPGLHRETLDEVKSQINTIRQRFVVDQRLVFDAARAVKLDGYLTVFLANAFPDIELLPSVRAGLEMALIGLAACQLEIPIHQAILLDVVSAHQAESIVELNGLMTRGPLALHVPKQYGTLKIKVGHQTADEELKHLQLVLEGGGETARKIRLDANRAWNATGATEFAGRLVDTSVQDRIEFVEEPLLPARGGNGSLRFDAHVTALEVWSETTNLSYALDETLGDLVHELGSDFAAIETKLSSMFSRERPRGCAAFVLKPTLLGLEMSLQLARLARERYGMGAVFSSSFDSGVGLAYTGFLALASDAAGAPKAPIYAHGLSTYENLQDDVLSPPFSSYVDNKGQLQPATISRALYGISIAEMNIPNVSEYESAEKVVEPQAS